MSKLEQVVSKTNLFGQPLELNYETDTKHGIFLPFLSTLILLVIISYSAISSISDLLNYRKISVTGFRQLLTNQNQINATIPMIAIKIDQLSLSDCKNFLGLQLYTMGKTGIGFSQFQQCTHQHWKNISREQYQKHNLSDYYCPKITNFSIASSQTIGIIQFAGITIRPIRWSKPYAYLQIIVFSQKVVENQEVPYINTVRNLSVMFIYPAKTQVQITYVKTKVQTDYSFLFTSIEEESMVQMEDFEYKYVPIGQPNKKNYSAFQSLNTTVLMGKKNIQKNQVNYYF